MKPSFTLTYGMGWTLEMPPTEASGKQTVLVDDCDTPVKTLDYLAQRKNAALQGEVYRPELGFALVGNVGSGRKYPYDPFYGSFSPRVAAAWNPSFDGDGFLSKVFGHADTVIRGGYGRIYGRLNGVDLVLVPLLGVGLIQPVQCSQALPPANADPPTRPSRAPTRHSASASTETRHPWRPPAPRSLSRSIPAITTASPRRLKVSTPTSAPTSPTLRSDHPAQDQLPPDTRTWLHRPAGSPRVPAGQPQRGSLHDGQGRTGI